MGWFRSGRRPWGWVALLALVLQLGLSFGHVHGLDAEPSGKAAASVAHGGTNPSKPDTGDHDDDYCAICAIMAMLSGAQTASAPALASPISLASAETAASPETIDIASTPSAFRSRAPPQA